MADDGANQVQLHIILSIGVAGVRPEQRISPVRPAWSADCQRIGDTLHRAPPYWARRYARSVFLSQSPTLPEGILPTRHSCPVSVPDRIYAS